MTYNNTTISGESVEIPEITVSFPAKVKKRRKFKVKVSLPNAVEGLTKIVVLFNRFGEAPTVTSDLQLTEKREYDTEYCATVRLPRVSKYDFFFIVEINGQEMAIKVNRETGKPFITLGEAPYWSILVCNDFDMNQEAFGIVYQAFVDRFFKSENHKNAKSGRNYRSWGDEVDWRRNVHGMFHNNDFFAGDLQGLKEKLPYLNSLGVKWLYISPTNDSPLRADRYATINHKEIDPDCGTWKDMEDLCKEASKYGINVMQDIAFNHFSSENPIVIDAINNPNSIYKDWIKRDEYGNPVCWYGFGDMPEANQQSKGYQKYVAEVVELLAKHGVKGLRLDLAEALDTELLEVIYSEAQKAGMYFVVGEFWQNVELEKLGKCIHAPTCYPLTNAILKFIVFGEDTTLWNTVEELVENYPQDTIDSMLTSLSTHDIIRAMTIIAKRQYARTGWMDIWKIDEPPSPWHGYNSFDTDGFRQFEYENDKISKEGYEYAKSLFKVATLLQYFILGNACIYYGDEAGLYGWKDPFNRKCYPWGSEDTDLVKFFRGLGVIRNRCNLTNCNPKLIYSDHDIFSFVRGDDVFVAVNRSENTRNVQIPEEFKDGEVFVLNNHNYLPTEGNLNPRSGIVILKK